MAGAQQQMSDLVRDHEPAQTAGPHVVAVGVNLHFVEEDPYQPSTPAFRVALDGCESKAQVAGVGRSHRRLHVNGDLDGHVEGAVLPGAAVDLVPPENP